MNQNPPSRCDQTFAEFVSARCTVPLTEGSGLPAPSPPLGKEELGRDRKDHWSKKESILPVSLCTARMLQIESGYEKEA